MWGFKKTPKSLEFDVCYSNSQHSLIKKVNVFRSNNLLYNPSDVNIFTLRQTLKETCFQGNMVKEVVSKLFAIPKFERTLKQNYRL